MKKQNYLSWVFKNKWYYFVPIIWIVFWLALSFILQIQSTFVFPEEIKISFSFFIQSIFSIIFYYLLWQIPFFIFWFIFRRNKKRKEKNIYFLVF